MKFSEVPLGEPFIVRADIGGGDIRVYVRTDKSREGAVRKLVLTEPSLLTGALGMRYDFIKINRSIPPDEEITIVNFSLKTS